jgi:hypothetical protein
MKRFSFYVSAILAVMMTATMPAGAQTGVPGGINYQAVARDNNGNELVNTAIEVRFSIRTGSPTGPVIYQEVFTDVTTSRYGVFSLVIGKGDPVLGTFTAIDWSTANHYLTVEVKFENLFMDMGTMQFMAVPYALYAARSLEAGPAGPPGPKGDPGDPATDDQTLSYSRGTKELTISGGNTVTLDNEVAFRARNLISDLAAPLSNVIMTYDSPDLSVGSGFDPATGVFTAPYDGIYTFNVSYNADGDDGDARKVSIYVNSALYETIGTGITHGTTILVRSVTIRLSTGNTVTVVVNTGTSNQTGTGTFAGYKVN